MEVALESHQPGQSVASGSFLDFCPTSTDSTIGISCLPIWITPWNSIEISPNELIAPVTPYGYFVWQFHKG